MLHSRRQVGGRWRETSQARMVRKCHEQSGDRGSAVRYS